MQIRRSRYSRHDGEPISRSHQGQWVKSGIACHRRCDDVQLDPLYRKASSSLTGSNLAKSRIIGLGAEASVGGARRQLAHSNLKEVIQVAHLHVGSVAILAILMRREVRG
jgi:hypothetical protein